MPVIKYHPIVRGLAVSLAYVVGVPLVKVMEISGQASRMFRFLSIPNLLGEKRLYGFFGDYEPDARDVFVVTYPKSGTNWMMQIAYQILHDGDGEFNYIHDKIPWADGQFLTPDTSLDDPDSYIPPTGLRVLKSHLPMQYIPYNEKAKYIFVLRDPKDVFVSSYHFFKDVNYGVLMPSVETYLNVFLSDSAMFCSVASHMDSYWQMRDKPDTLVVTFGEMKADLDGIIRRVADFMDVELSYPGFERVKEKTSFGYMKNIDHKFHPGRVTPFAPGKGGMIRKGNKGKSGELLSIEQQQRIDEYIREELSRIGSDLPYDKLFS